MKKYTTQHTKKEVAEKHIAKIEKRGGVAFLTEKNGSFVVEYAFPEITLPDKKLLKTVYYQNIKLGDDEIGITIIEYDKSFFSNLSFAKNRYYVLVNDKYDDSAVWKMKVNKYLKKNVFNNTGSTLALAMSIVKDLEAAAFDFTKNAKKITESKKKGNNLYIRLEKKQNDIKSLFKRYNSILKYA